jgi:crotonobetainyl-CoA:carnitine CoA-transferase CaiB-like acyl-CoA transferase
LNNLRPGAVDRLGLGYEALGALNPRLIFCQVSAFGLKGPLATLPGGDPLAGALTGMQSAQGGYGERPVYTYGAPIDYTSGFLAAAAVLIGLHRRGPSGLGDFVDTSLLDAGALLNAGAMTAYAGRPPRDDLPKGQYRRNALNGLYRTASGWVAIAIVGADEWDHFRQAVGPGAPQLPPKTDACSDDDLAHVLSDVLLSRDSEFWFRTLSAAGLSCVAVRPKSEVGLSDPWVVTNGWVARHTSPGRKSVSFIDNWLAMSHGTCHSRGAAPGLGEHTDDVLDSVGLDPELRRHLRRSGTVSGGSI